MATLKYRLNRKNASGTYDTIHYETSSNIVMRPSGRTVEQDLADFLPRSQDNDNVPQSLTVGQISVANNKVFCKLGSGITKDLSADTIVQVVDNLTSSSTTSALSANQGRLLNDKIAAASSAFKLISNFSGSYTSNGIADSDRRLAGTVTLSGYKIVHLFFSGSKAGRKVATSLELDDTALLAASWMDQTWSIGTIYFSAPSYIFNWSQSVTKLSGTLYIRADAGQVTYSVQIYGIS